MSKTYLTWTNIEVDCQALAEQVFTRKFDTIVGIANGGMIPATILAKKLKINRLLSANIKSYQEDKPRDGAHNTSDVVKTLSFPSYRDLMESRSILFVDDLSDTGLTLKHINEKYYYHTNPNHNKWEFATLYYKPKTEFKPEYTVRSYDNDEWIVFPWE